MRAAVLEGVEYLLDCPMAVPLLQGLLPALAPLLHDRSEKTRVAFVKLLQVRFIMSPLAARSCVLRPFSAP